MSDSELRAKLRPIFDKFDIDGSGMVSPDEIATMVKMLKMQMTDEQLVQLMVDADPDGSGAIDFDEFMAVLSKQLGEGKSDGLASVFSGASSMFGFLNPSLGGRGRAPPSPPGWLRGMPPLGQPQEAAPLRLSAIGYTQWVVQSSNRSTADGMREEEMLRKAFKAEQKARFLAAQHRRVRAIKLHERVGQKKAAELCEHKRQYNQQLQQHLNAMQRYTNQKDAYEIYQKARTVKDGHQKQRLQREDENRKLADSGAAHENHEAREMRREQARVTRERVLAEKRQMAQHVQDETRPSVRQEGRNMFQAQRDAAAQAVAELTAENRGRIAFAKQEFVRENEQTHQEVQAMTRKARRARFELGSQRQQEADELRRKLEAERDRKRQLSGETSSWLLERHLSVFESRFASEEHAEKVAV
ncbi:calmodulin-like protein 8 [Chrysochromulina tobinii]|uniref:Calmodulin-like protein 8 n=1 Tax=Chrysochromulina tobinii TaxID=1460289 RepID=A0A0M0JTB4_9EUKA|nr:calmodulin-like protein 8 [Chrysochromulina tobinii]|eukprot:KOO29901.1 calmodulin-like protein 8 [Chrysochromulina sp. CCMP291]